MTTMTQFDAWMKTHQGRPSVSEQIQLAKELCDRASSIESERKSHNSSGERDGRSSCSAKPEFPLVSWKGVSARWFNQVFMRTRELQMFLSFGCRMWFVRNRCITEMLRRRGVTSGGSVIDHMSKLSHQQDGSSHMTTFNIESTTATLDGEADATEEASCFISYTGEMTLEQFSALIEHDSLAGKRLWMDVICVCQFSWTERKDDEMKQFKEGFLHELRNRIASIGMTALLVSRWDDVMVALGKIWVLWEIFSTVDGEASLDVLFTDPEEARFIEDVMLTTGGLERIDDSVSKVDANNAWSFVPEDRTMIFSLMEESDGVFNVNKMVLKCLRSWFVNRAEDFYNRLEQQGENVDLYRGTLISLHMRFGDIATATRMGRDKIDSITNKFGDAHELTLTAMNQLAMTLTDDGTPSSMIEAEAVLKNVLEKCKVHFGQDHDIFISALQILASLTRRQRLNDDAESYLRLALSSQVRLHGSNHPDTMSIKEDLVELLAEKNSISEDEVFQFRRLEELRAQLGSRHPKTLDAMTSLANYLETVDNLPEAEALYREVMRTMTEQLGAESDLRLTAVKALASVLHREDKLDASESLFREAFGIERKTLGEGHSTALDTMDNLCTVLNENGKLKEADQLSLKCVMRSENSLGREHHDTLAFAHNRAQLLFGQDRGQEAVRLLREVVHRHRAVLGESHSDTIRVSTNLGVMVAQLGDLDDGISIVEAAVRIATRSLEEDHPMVSYARDVREALRETIHVSDK